MKSNFQLEFVAPLLFQDIHELSVMINQLQVTASSPSSSPDQLEVSLKAGSYCGKIDLKLDITTILTDVLDLVELKDRVWGQGIF